MPHFTETSQPRTTRCQATGGLAWPGGSARRGWAAWLTCVIVGICLLAACPLVVCAAESDRLRQAQRLLRQGRYEEALEAFEPLRDVHPVAVALGEARCLRAQGKYDQAEERLRSASGMSAESDQVPAELARLAFERGRYEQAAEHVSEALERVKDSVAARWWRAELDRVQGRIDQARNGYLELVQDYNQRRIEDVEQLRWIGLAAAQHARFTGNHNQLQALVGDFYPACLRRDEQFWEAHLDAARLFLEKYNRAETLVQLNAALAINPNASEVHAARAELALQDLDLTAAIRLLEASVDPRQPLRDGLELLAELRLRDQQYDEAARLYRIGLERFRHEEDLWLKSLARVYLASEDQDALAVVLRRLAELDDDSPSIRKKLAQLALDKQDFAEAGQWANRALEIDVQDAASHALLAASLMGRKQYDEAAAEYEVAVRLDGRQAAWYLDLAQALMQADQPRRAREIVERLLKIAPDYPGADTLLEKLSK